MKKKRRTYVTYRDREKASIKISFLRSDCRSVGISNHQRRIFARAQRQSFDWQSQHPCQPSLRGKLFVCPDYTSENWNRPASISKNSFFFWRSKDLTVSLSTLTFWVPHEQVDPGEEDDETQRNHQQLQLPSARAEHHGIVEDWAGKGWSDQVGVTLTLVSFSILSSGIKDGEKEREGLFVCYVWGICPVDVKLFY